MFSLQPKNSDEKIEDLEKTLNQKNAIISKQTKVAHEDKATIRQLVNRVKQLGKAVVFVKMSSKL